MATRANAKRRQAPDGAAKGRPQTSAIPHVLDATRNTLHGLIAAWRSEAAFRQEMVVFLVAVPIGLFVAPGVAWYVAMIGSLLIVLAVELLNTATEKLADHVAPGQHPDIGRVKDYGSAAVACSLTLAGLVWLAALVLRVGLI
jgi:diacylglycerol kinase (ATP)